jgi:DNA-binding transcriptional ArsR family regulator
MENTTLAHEVNQLHAELCAALAEPRRIVLLYALAEQSRHVNDLATELGMTQSAASRHLKLLRERGLVRAIRRGANVEYRLADPRLIQALDLLRAVLRDRLSHTASLIETGIDEPDIEADLSAKEGALLNT